MLVRNGTRRRGDATLGAEAVAPAADDDAQSDTAALASCSKHRGRARGNSVFPHPFQTALISRSAHPVFPARTEQNTERLEDIDSATANRNAGRQVRVPLAGGKPRPDGPTHCFRQDSQCQGEGR